MALLCVVIHLLDAILQWNLWWRIRILQRKGATLQDVSWRTRNAHIPENCFHPDNWFVVVAVTIYSLDSDPNVASKYFGSLAAAAVDTRSDYFQCNCYCFHSNYFDCWTLDQHSRSIRCALVRKLMAAVLTVAAQIVELAVELSALVFVDRILLFVARHVVWKFDAVAYNCAIKAEKKNQIIRISRSERFTICNHKTNSTHFSKVFCVCCWMAVTIGRWVFIKLVLYSAIDEFGDCSFDITHASNRFDFDSHSDNNFNSLAFCSSVATEKLYMFSRLPMINAAMANAKYTHLFQHYKTSEWQYFLNCFLNRPHVFEHWKTEDKNMNF